MTRSAALSRSPTQLEDAALEARGYQRCEQCRKQLPLVKEHTALAFVPESFQSPVGTLRPERAERVAGYVSKYLAKWKEDGSCEVTETVLAAGRSYLNYVSRKLTAKSGCTMRVLRNVRIAWAWRAGYLPDDAIDPFDLLTGLLLLEQFELQRRSRAP